MSADIKILQDNYKTESDPDIHERILIVIELKRGESTRDIADRFGFSQGKVIYWSKRFRKEGLDGLMTRPRSGKPRKLSDKEIEKIKEKLENSPYGWTSKSVREMIYNDHGVMYGYRHIVRLLHKWDFRMIRPRKKNVATASEAEIKAFIKMPKKSWIRYQKAGQQ